MHSSLTTEGRKAIADSLKLNYTLTNLDLCYSDINDVEYTAFKEIFKVRSRIADNCVASFCFPLTIIQDELVTNIKAMAFDKFDVNFIE